MHSRLIALLVLLATVMQGPALGYAASLGSSSDAVNHACADLTLLDRQACDACCTHGAMPSCAAQCPVLTGVAVPLSLPNSLRIAVRGALIPDAGVAPFAEHDPPHPLRPPIV